jgi:hypothetical protein
MTRGYLIVAENSETNYVQCAEVLAASLQRAMPGCSVSILTNDTVSRPELFSHVIPLDIHPISEDDPYRICNDVQVWAKSPYDQTIKIEADMFIPPNVNLDHWWDAFTDRDIVVCSTARNFKNDLAISRFYRHVIDNNNLPNTYNAFTYFNKSEFAKQFFEVVANVNENWEEYKKLLKCNIDEVVTTDFAYSMAAHIMTPEKTMMPSFTSFSMIHMKKYVNHAKADDFTLEFVTELLPHCVRIATHPLRYPLHYRIKHFVNDLEKAYV